MRKLWQEPDKFKRHIKQKLFTARKIIHGHTLWITKFLNTQSSLYPIKKSITYLIYFANLKPGTTKLWYVCYLWISFPLYPGTLDPQLLHPQQLDIQIMQKPFQWWQVRMEAYGLSMQHGPLCTGDLSDLPAQSHRASTSQSNLFISEES